MLKGIPTEISPELLYSLAEAGHGDIIAIVDDFYPARSKTPEGEVIYAKGVTAPEMLSAILKLCPLDTIFEEHPVEHMCPDPDFRKPEEEPLSVWQKAETVLVENGYEKEIMGEIERTKFYEKASKAVLTISTSERESYGCFLIQKGVM